MPQDSLILVTGPTRSGKSDWAEGLAHQSAQPVLYIATAAQDPTDAEWQCRIQAHRERRPAHWLTWEIPQSLTIAIAQAPADYCILVDSLGTWVANCLEQSPHTWRETQANLLTQLQATSQSIIFVAEEVGWSMVSPYPAGRLFCDRLGGLVREIGTIADALYLVVAGYALDLKRSGKPVTPNLWQP
jgi:adenosylcobinamide kinase/adenosylcobinamide-phosphate guanylyltransferase